MKLGWGTAVGSNIKKILKLKKLSQEGLAEKCLLQTSVVS